MNKQTVLSLKTVTRSYPQAGGSGQLDVLKGVSLDLHAGELVALVGPSGSGKSTLLHAVGLLDRPSSGDILVDGKQVTALDDASRTQLRGRSIGFVYQFHHLLPEFTALENVILPQMIVGVPKAKAAERAQYLLEQVGLGQRSHHRPGQLSGGEQQRVAIARALANKPKLLIADEPTGNLDPKTAIEVFELLKSITRTEGLAALVATHNFDLARAMDRVLQLQNGMLVEGALAA